MTKNRIVAIGVEDVETGKWVEIVETNIICPDCEILRNLRVKMIRLENGDYQCARCRMIILKPAWGAI